MKFAEKIYYVFLLALGFLLYKSPALLALTFNKNPHITIPVFSALVIIFHLANAYLEKQEQSAIRKHAKIKDKLKDTKRHLISEIDPVLVATVKEIVKNDMRKEIEAMKSSDDGCSQKCKLINEMLTKDVARNRDVVNEVIQFKWCEICLAGK